MSKLVKLTGPRRALLKDLAEQRRPVHATYPPLVWLVAQGYVDGRKVSYRETWGEIDRLGGKVEIGVQG